jgi:hypothetical protein
MSRNQEDGAIQPQFKAIAAAGFCNSVRMRWVWCGDCFGFFEW